MAGAGGPEFTPLGDRGLISEDNLTLAEAHSFSYALATRLRHDDSGQHGGRPRNAKVMNSDFACQHIRVPVNALILRWHSDLHGLQGLPLSRGEPDDIKSRPDVRGAPPCSCRGGRNRRVSSLAHPTGGNKDAEVPA